MHPDVWCRYVSRAARWGWVLWLVWGLAGCATTAGGGAGPGWGGERGRFEAPWGSARPRILLAMNGDGAGGDSSGPVLQGYNVPGRNPDSQMPWEFFLGHASHRMIAFMYGVNHPRNEAYFNVKPIGAIFDETGIGDSSRLLPEEKRLCPDIMDVQRRILFEIKPGNERGLKEGRVEARKYLAAVNRAIRDGRVFTGGTDFSGEILIRFAGGKHIWRLEWKTPEPGIVQYRWTRSQQPFDSEMAAYQAAQWVDLTEAELRQYGGWVEKAVEGMVSRREALDAISGSVGVVIDVTGGAAAAVLWGAILDQMSPGAANQQPPAESGGKVIDFPVRPPPAESPPAQIPAAASMSLPR